MFEVQQALSFIPLTTSKNYQSFDEGKLQLVSLIVSVFMAYCLDVGMLSLQEHCHLHLLTPFY